MTERPEDIGDRLDAQERRCQSALYGRTCMNCGGELDAKLDDADDVILFCDQPQELGGRGCGWSGRAEE